MQAWATQKSPSSRRSQPCSGSQAPPGASPELEAELRPLCSTLRQCDPALFGHLARMMRATPVAMLRPYAYALQQTFARRSGAGSAAERTGGGATSPPPMMGYGGAMVPTPQQLQQQQQWLTQNAASPLDAVAAPVHMQGVGAWSGQAGLLGGLRRRR